MENSNGGEVKINFSTDSERSDPQKQPVIIVGQLTCLNKITFDDVRHKLEPRVTEEVFKNALSTLHPNTADTISLYINLATLASLPNKCSRHNSSARPHALAGVIKSNSSGASETIIVVCPFSDVLASAAAIARSYPAFSMKTMAGKNATVEVTVEFILTDKESSPALDCVLLTTLSQAVREAAAIVDTPCNLMNVTNFIEEISNVVREFPELEMTVIRGKELKERGMNGIYSVGRASNVEPALVVVKYCPAVKTECATVAWVGKGIVYDTGGLSIKSKVMMPGMKRDCAGAAAILGALRVAAELCVATELYGVFCLAENSVGPNSTRPDDIETLYSGRTVEINNTDAEGRLVLADGVVYAARDLKADLVIDIATLTGAQGIATGKYHGALLTNCQDCETELLGISRISGDLLFPIPYSPELHFPEFNSAVADMKNSVGDRANAQSSCAGLFILAHLGFDFPGKWIHIDMASPAYSGERATGYGVALLTLYVSKHSQNEMLRHLYELSQE
ncbi:probable aminopeptidase NPEPL1 granny smith protein [Rhodnius prolixus]|uniref:Putative aminopeptidase of the m17 family n=2 Tax=Rhodnius TaxID=13248 RepID=R4G844_RHOPR